METVNESDIRNLIATLAGTEWSWTPDQIPKITARLGWDLVEVIDGKAAFAAADWSLGEDDIEFALNKSQVNDITIPLTDIIPGNSADCQTMLLDAFARVVTAGTSTIGPPTEQTAGSQPTARWRRSGSTIIVVHAKVALELTWANNTFQDHWDALRDDPNR